MQLSKEHKLLLAAENERLLAELERMRRMTRAKRQEERLKRIEENWPLCRVCNRYIKSHLQRHHISYNPPEVIPVHGRCHFLIHFRGVRQDLVPIELRPTDHGRAFREAIDRNLLNEKKLLKASPMNPDPPWDKSQGIGESSLRARSDSLRLLVRSYLRIFSLQ